MPPAPAETAGPCSGMIHGMAHPNALLALEHHRPRGTPAWVPRCVLVKRDGAPCRAAAMRGRSRCYHHGGSTHTQAKTPHQIACRALKRAERQGLIPLELMTNPAWVRAGERRSANAGARLQMLAAWGAKDPEAWARAVQAVV
jgi:hypothetical protein